MKYFIVILLGFSVISCAAKKPSADYDYHSGKYSSLNPLQRQQLRLDMSIECEDIDRTVSGTKAHRDCVSRRLEEREEHVKQRAVASAGATNVNQTTTVKNETFVERINPFD